MAIGKRRNGSGDGYWLLEGKKDMGWRRRRIVRRRKSRKPSTLRPSSDCPVIFVTAPKLSIVVQLAMFRIQFQFVVPALLSNIASSRGRQLEFSRRAVPRLYFEIINPVFCVFDCHAWVVGTIGIPVFQRAFAIEIVMHDEQSRFRVQTQNCHSEGSKRVVN